MVQMQKKLLAYAITQMQLIVVIRVKQAVVHAVAILGVQDIRIVAEVTADRVLILLQILLHLHSMMDVQVIRQAMKYVIA